MYKQKNRQTQSKMKKKQHADTGKARNTDIHTDKVTNTCTDIPRQSKLRIKRDDNKDILC